MYKFLKTHTIEIMNSNKVNLNSVAKLKTIVFVFCFLLISNLELYAQTATTECFCPVRVSCEGNGNINVRFAVRDDDPEAFVAAKGSIELDGRTFNAGNPSNFSVNYTPADGNGCDDLGTAPEILAAIIATSGCTPRPCNCPIEVNCFEEDGLIGLNIDFANGTDLNVFNEKTFFSVELDGVSFDAGGASGTTVFYSGSRCPDLTSEESITELMMSVGCLLPPPCEPNSPMFLPRNPTTSGPSNSSN